MALGDLGLASFSVSRNGVLVYRAGELTGTRLVWLDRSGKETPVMDAPADYRDTALSPDGTRLAYDIIDSANSRGDIWIRDLARGVSSRFTFDAAAELSPLWSPDGRRVVFTTRAKGPGDLFIKDASGTKEAEPLLVSPDEKYVSDWSRDGRYILFFSRGQNDNGWDIFAMPIDGDKKPFAIVKTKFNELWATFSPDGKYIAYQSNESGRSEIYVHEFPEARNKWQVSLEGGTQPLWRGDGRELFYRAVNAVMAVPVQAGAGFTRGHSGEAVRHAVCGGHHARALSADAGRPALPGAGAAGARGRTAGRGRVELDVGAEELNRSHDGTRARRPSGRLRSAGASRRGGHGRSLARQRSASPSQGSPEGSAASNSIATRRALPDSSRKRVWRRL